METAILAGLTVLVLMFVFNGLSALIIVCEPNEVVVLSGFGGRDKSTGESRGYRFLQAGWAFKIPFLERADRLDMRLMPIDITVENAYSEGAIPLTIRAIANVKISGDGRLIGNAMERFLGMPREEIEKVARQTLEGNLRTVLATMTPEDVNQDRLTFSEKIQEEVEEDLSKLGLAVDTLKIQNVSDSVDYLGSISRAAVARVQREASVAQSDAERGIGSAEAEAEALIGVAEQQADEAIKRKKNQLDALKAKLNGDVDSELERTEAAGREAKAEAEKELQEIRSRLAELRLQAEMVLPARAEETARRLQAEGESALIAERGQATADGMRELAGSWNRASGTARDIFLLEKMDSVLERVVDKVTRVRPGSVSLVDTEGGQALSGYVASYPAMVTSVLEELRRTLGVDFRESLVGDGSPAGAPSTSGGEELDAEITAEELLGLVAAEVARAGEFGDKEEKLVTRIGTLIGVADETQQELVERTRAALDGGELPPGRTSVEAIYRRAYEMAMRDGKVSKKERSLLDAFAGAVRIPDAARTRIESQVRG